MPYRIVAIGDSIVWGQGLLQAEKFDVLVQQALAPAHPEGVTLESSAHSGAIIGARGATGVPQVGEVPASRLSIMEQCDAFSNAPESVDLVLLDGGINDVGVSSILNPFALIPPLNVRVKHSCHDDMLTLLRKVGAKFSKPSCKIRVTGYYTILSAQSDPLGVIKLLSLFGIAVPPFVNSQRDVIDPVLKRCAEFSADSTRDLQQAVADSGDPRIRFVDNGFTEANSVFAANSLLWGLDLTDDLNPQDPVAATRRPLCDIAHPGPLELLPREQCFRASAGHPNVQGAQQFANKILATI
jgi:lysophospholipase L1-like esterase